MRISINQDFSSIHINLLKWFKNNKRELTFREDRNPYKVWVSEVMLQQTRVSYMLPIFINFVHKFPTVFDLAKAKEQEVLTYWKGLGYYNRAINLHKGSKYIVQKFSGNFPTTLDEILAIPGIGPYTARAILSIGFNLRFAVLDGNVKRVLSRYFLIKGNIDLNSTQNQLQEYADIFLNPYYPSEHNEALMELGAVVCIHKNPRCFFCPLFLTCRSMKEGLQSILPITSSKQKKIEAELIFCFFKKDGKILLVRDKNRPFFKRVYSLPFIYKDRNKKILPTYLLNYKLNYLNKTHKHNITKYNLILKVAFCENSFDLIQTKDFDFLFVDEDKWEDMFPSSITKKIIKILN